MRLNSAFVRMEDVRRASEISNARFIGALLGFVVGAGVVVLVLVFA